MAENFNTLVTSTRHVLPFDSLSPADFERLCFWLVSQEGYDNAQHWGAQGQDQGLDIVAWDRGQMWGFQCKQVRRFGPKDAVAEIEKVLAQQPDPPRLVGLVFIVSAAVSARTRDAVRLYLEDRLEGRLECIFWARTELDQRVKRHPNIFEEFFGLAPLNGSELALQVDIEDSGKVADEVSVLREAVHTDPKGSPSEGLNIARYLGVADSAITASAASDQPIQDKAKDRLGFAVYAEAFRDFISSEDTVTPLTIGIDAPWGHGKTSLMRMIRQELDPKYPWHMLLRAWWELQKWRVVLVAASPLWLLGRVMMWVAKKQKWHKYKIFAAVAKGISCRKAGQSKDTATAGVPHSMDNASVLEKLFAWCEMTHRPLQARHLTVWFNAWKFDQEEEVWAALALAILDQIRRNHNCLGRVLFWGRLWLMRIKHIRAWKELFRRTAWPIVLGIGGWLWVQHSSKIGFIPDDAKNFGQWVLWGGAAVKVVADLATIVENPFSLDWESLADQPDYRDKIGFLGQFQEDFERIVKIATRRVWGWTPRKLVVFIDDLDRCEPPKPADVMEAISVFLDSPGCVFVIGMDSRAVIASIETKYRTLFRKMRKESPGRQGLGRCFMEKIIQIPFTIPSITEQSMSRLLDDIIGPSPVLPGETGEKGGSAGEAPAQIDRPESPAGVRRTEDVGRYYRVSHVWKAIETGVKYLEANPRQLKRFVNLFRLQLYIANARNLFRELLAGDQPRSGYTVESLAAWTALSMRWPQIVSCLKRQPQHGRLREFLLVIAAVVTNEGDWVEESVAELSDEARSDLSRLLGIIPTPDGVSSLAETIGAGLRAEQEKWRSEHGQDGSSAHAGVRFSALPWEEWLANADFLRVVKALEVWWGAPIEEQTDWVTMAFMCDHQ